VGDWGNSVVQTSSGLPETWYPGKNVFVAVNWDQAISQQTSWSGLDELGFERGPRLTYAEIRGSDKRVAQCLAEAHRDLAASLPLDSRVRALALRCGDHWGRLAGLPHGLTKVQR
jgi:hypothetical protein